MVKYKLIIEYYQKGNNNSQIATLCGCSRTVVWEVLNRFNKIETIFADIQRMSEEELRILLFPERVKKDKGYLIPDFKWEEFQMRKHQSSLRLCWRRYCKRAAKQNLKAYSWASFGLFYIQYRKPCSDEDDPNDKVRLNQDIAKLDEKMKRLTRMRLEDEISKEEFLEYKSEIEKEREKVVQQRLAFEAGVETRTDSDSVEGKIQNFLLQKMDFTEHYVDRDIISQFVDTVIPRSETCYEWYMDFDLIEKPNEKKKMVWSFKIDYNEAKTYRKEREGMLRPNQWEDLIVRVYI